MHRNKQGFTLLELMFAMLASAILILIVGLLITMPYRAMNGNQEFAQVRRDMALAVKIMTKDIRQATNDDIVPSSNQLVLNANPGPPVRLPIRYALESGALNRYVNGGSGVTIIEKGVTRFVAVKTSGLSGVEIQLDLQSNDGTAAITHETFIHTRN